MMNAACFSRFSLALLVLTRMAVSLVLAVAITSGVAFAAQAADNRSGHNLVQACETELAAPTSWCAAYLMGVADTLTAFGEGRLSRRRLSPPHCATSRTVMTSVCISPAAKSRNEKLGENWGE